MRFVVKSHSRATYVDTANYEMGQYFHRGLWSKRLNTKLANSLGLHSFKIIPNITPTSQEPILTFCGNGMPDFMEVKATQ